MKQRSKAIATLAMLAILTLIPNANVLAQVNLGNPATGNQHRLTWEFGLDTLTREQMQRIIDTAGGVVHIPLFATFPADVGFPVGNTWLGATTFNFEIREFDMTPITRDGGVNILGGDPMSVAFGSDRVVARHIPTTEGFMITGASPMAFQPASANENLIRTQANWGGTTGSGHLSPIPGTRTLLFNYPVRILEVGSFMLCVNVEFPFDCPGGYLSACPAGGARLILNINQGGSAITNNTPTSGPDFTISTWADGSLIPGQGTLNYRPFVFNRFVCGGIFMPMAPEVVVSMPSQCPWDTASVFVTADAFGEDITGVELVTGTGEVFATVAGNTGYITLHPSLQGQVRVYNSLGEEVTADGFGPLGGTFFGRFLLDAYAVVPSAFFNGGDLIARVWTGPGVDDIGSDTLVVAIPMESRTEIFVNRAGLMPGAPPNPDFLIPHVAGSHAENRKNYILEVGDAILLSTISGGTAMTPVVQYYQILDGGLMIPIASVGNFAGVTVTGSSRFIGFRNIGGGCRIPTDTVVITGSMLVDVTADATACPGIDYTDLRVRIENPTGTPVNFSTIEFYFDMGDGPIGLIELDMIEPVGLPAPSAVTMIPLQFMITGDLLDLLASIGIYAPEFTMVVENPDAPGTFITRYITVNIDPPAPDLAGFFNAVAITSAPCGAAREIRFAGNVNLNAHFTTFSVFYSAASTPAPIPDFLVSGASNISAGASFPVTIASNQNFWRFVGQSAAGCVIDRSVALTSTGDCEPMPLIRNLYGHGACDGVIVLEARFPVGSGGSATNWSWWLAGNDFPTILEGGPPVHMYSIQNVGTLWQGELEALGWLDLFGTTWGAWPFTNLTVDPIFISSDGTYSRLTIRAASGQAGLDDLAAFIAMQRAGGDFSIVVNAVATPNVECYLEDVGDVPCELIAWMNTVLLTSAGTFINFQNNLVRFNMPEFRPALVPLAGIAGHIFDNGTSVGQSVTMLPGQDTAIGAVPNTIRPLATAGIGEGGTGYNNLIVSGGGAFEDMLRGWWQHSHDNGTTWTDIALADDGLGGLNDGGFSAMQRIQFSDGPQGHSHNLYRILFRFDNAPTCMPTPGTPALIEVLSGEDVGTISFVGGHTDTVICAASLVGLPIINISAQGSGMLAGHRHEFSRTGNAPWTMLRETATNTSAYLFDLGDSRVNFQFDETIYIRVMGIGSETGADLPSNTVRITLRQTPNIGTLTTNPAGLTQMCSGGSVQISANAVAGGTWSWTSSVSGSLASTTNVLTFAPTGTGTQMHTITATVTLNGCSATANIPMTVFQTPVIDNITPIDLCWFQTGNIAEVEFTAGPGGHTFEWTPTAGGTTISLTTPARGRWECAERLSADVTATYNVVVRRTAQPYCHSAPQAVTITTLFCGTYGDPSIFFQFGGPTSPDFCDGGWYQDQFRQNGLQIGFNPISGTNLPQMEEARIYRRVGTDSILVPSGYISTSGNYFFIDHAFFDTTNNNTQFIFFVVQTCHLQTNELTFNYTGCLSEPVNVTNVTPSSACAGSFENVVLTVTSALAIDLPASGEIDVVRPGGGQQRLQGVSVTGSASPFTITIPREFASADQFAEAGLHRIVVRNVSDIESDWDTANVTILELPAVPEFSGASNACQNGTSPQVTITNLPGGATVAWTINGTGAGSGGTLTVPTTNVGTQNIVATVTASNTCTSTGNTSLDILELPTISLTQGNATNERCDLFQTTVVATLSSSATIAWTGFTSETGTTLTLPAVDWTHNQTIEATATHPTNGCTATATINLIGNLCPATDVSVTLPETQACEGAVPSAGVVVNITSEIAIATITVNGVNVNLTDNPVTSTGTNTWQVTLPASLFTVVGGAGNAIVVSNGQVGGTGNATFMVVATPAQPTGVSGGWACQGQTSVTLNATAPSGAQLFFSVENASTLGITVPSTGQAGNATITIPADIAYGTFNFSVYSRLTAAPNCYSAPVSGTFTVRERPAQRTVTLSPTAVCAGETIEITVSPAPANAANLTWSVSGATTPTGTGNPFTFTANATGAVQVTYTVNECTSVISTSVPFTVHTRPTLTNVTATQPCQGVAVGFTPSPAIPSGGQLRLFTSSDTTGFFEPSATEEWLAANNPHQFWAVMVNEHGCVSPTWGPGTVNLGQASAPIAITAINPASQCRNQTIEVTLDRAISTTPAETATWTIGGVAVTTVTGTGATRTLTIPAGVEDGSREVRLVVQIGDCGSQEATSTVTILPAIPGTINIVAGAPEAVCDSYTGTINLALNTADWGGQTPTTVRWYRNAVSGTDGLTQITGTGTTLGVTVSDMQVGNNFFRAFVEFACGSTTTAGVNIQLVETPTTPAINTINDVCAGSGAITATLASTITGEVTWTLFTDATQLWQGTGTANANSIQIPSEHLTEAGPRRLTANLATVSPIACTSTTTTEQTFTVIANSAPLTLSLNRTVVCPGDTTVIRLSRPLLATETILWSSLPGTVVPSELTNLTTDTFLLTLYNDATAGPNGILLNFSNNGCPSPTESASVYLTVIALPTQTNHVYQPTGGASPICYGTAPGTLSAMVFTPSYGNSITSIQWQSSTTSATEGFTNVGTASTAVPSYHTPGNLTQTTWFRTVATFGCAVDGPIASIAREITVEPVVNPPTGAASAICQGSTAGLNLAGGVTGLAASTSARFEVNSLGGGTTLDQFGAVGGHAGLPAGPHEFQVYAHRTVAGITGGCRSTSITGTLTVVELPTPLVITAIEPVCVGYQAAITFNSTDIVSGSTLDWIHGDPGNVINNLGGGNFTVTANVATTLAVRQQVANATHGVSCWSLPQTTPADVTLLTASPTPTITFAATSVCPNALAPTITAIGGTQHATAFEISWGTNVGDTIRADSHTDLITAFNANRPTLASATTFTLDVTYNACPAHRAVTQAITMLAVAPNPVIAFTGAGESVCSGTNVTFTVTSAGASIVLTGDVGQGFSTTTPGSGGTVTVTTGGANPLTPGQFTFTATATSAQGCPAVDTDTRTFTVRTMPSFTGSLTASPATNQCRHDEVVLTSVPSPAGAVVTWARTTDLTDILHTGAVHTVAPTWTDGTFRATVTYDNCSTHLEIAIATSPECEPTITMTASLPDICVDPADGTFRGGILDDGVPVLVSSNDGLRAILEFRITDTQNATPRVWTPPTTITPPASPATVTVYIPSEHFTRNEDVDLVHTITVYSTVTGVTDQTQVTVRRIPVAPTFNADTRTLCQGLTSLSLSGLITWPTETPMTWFNIGSTGTPNFTIAQDTYAVTNPSALSAGEYTFSAYYRTAQGCYSAIASGGLFRIRTTDFDVPQLNDPTPVCQGTDVTVTFATDLPSGLTFTWSPDLFDPTATPGEFVGTLAPGTPNITITSVQLEGCAQVSGITPNMVQARIYPTPTPATVAGQTNLCEGGVMDNLTATAPASPVSAMPFLYQWQHLPPSADVVTGWANIGSRVEIGDLNSEFSAPTNMAVGAHQFRVLTFSGACDSVASAPVTVNVLDQPSLGTLTAENEGPTYHGGFLGDNFNLPNIENSTLISWIWCRHDDAPTQDQIDVCTTGTSFATTAITTQTSLAQAITTLPTTEGFYIVRARAYRVPPAPAAHVTGCVVYVSNPVVIGMLADELLGDAQITLDDTPICIDQTTYARLVRGTGLFDEMVWDVSVNGGAWTQIGDWITLPDVPTSAEEYIYLNNTIITEAGEIRIRARVNRTSDDATGYIPFATLLVDALSVGGQIAPGSTTICYNTNFTSAITLANATGLTRNWFVAVGQGTPSPLGAGVTPTASPAGLGSYLLNIRDSVRIWAEVTNGACALVRSDTMTIRLYPRPVITDPGMVFNRSLLADYDLLAGDTVLYICLVTGASATQNRAHSIVTATGDNLTFYWYHSVSTGTDWGPWVQCDNGPANTHYFNPPTITAPATHALKRYRVVVRSNNCIYSADTSRIIHAHWLAQVVPSITMYLGDSPTPTTGPVCSDSEVTAVVGLTANWTLADLTISWYLNGTAETGNSATDYSTLTRTLVSPPENQTFLARVSNNVCRYVETTVGIQVVAEPEPFPVTADPAQICVGQATTITTTGTDPAPSHRWLFIGEDVADATATMPPMNGTANANWALLTDFTAGGTTGIRLRAPVETARLDTTHFVRAQFGAHLGAGVTCPPAFSDAVEVRVYATPTLSATAPPTSVDVCVTATDIAISLPAGATARGNWVWQIRTGTSPDTWDNVTTGTGLSGTGAVSTLEIPSLAVGTHVFRVLVTNGACVPTTEVASATRTVVVWDEITVGTIAPLESLICQGGVVDFTVTGTNYGTGSNALLTEVRWTVSGTASGTGSMGPYNTESAEITFGGVAQTFMVNVELRNPGCQTWAEGTAVEVRTIPTISAPTLEIVIDGPICQGESITFRVTNMNSDATHIEIHNNNVLGTPVATGEIDHDLTALYITWYNVPAGTYNFVARAIVEGETGTCFQSVASSPALPFRVNATSVAGRLDWVTGVGYRPYDTVSVGLNSNLMRLRYGTYTTSATVSNVIFHGQIRHNETEAWQSLPNFGATHALGGPGRGVLPTAGFMGQDSVQIRVFIANEGCDADTTNIITLHLEEAEQVFITANPEACLNEEITLTLIGDRILDLTPSSPGAITQGTWRWELWDGDLTDDATTGATQSDAGTIDDYEFDYRTQLFTVNQLGFYHFIFDYHSTLVEGGQASDTIVVRVHPRSSAGSIVPPSITQLCAGDADGIELNLGAHTGEVVAWIFSSTGDVDGPWTSRGGAGETSFTTGTQVATDSGYFRVVVQSGPVGICPPDTTGGILIQVFTATEAGAITTPIGSPICETALTGVELTLDGAQVGSILRWEFTNDGGLTWTDRGNAGLSTFTTGTDPVLDSGYFRAVIRSGAEGICAVEFTDSVLVAVFSEPVAGELTITSGDAIACELGEAPVLTLALENGTVLRWEISTDSLVWNPVTPGMGTATETTFTPSTSYSDIFGQHWFRAIVENGPCDVDSSNGVRVTIVSLDDPPGTITGGDLLLFHETDFVIGVDAIDPDVLLGDPFTWLYTRDITAVPVEWNNVATSPTFGFEHEIRGTTLGNYTDSLEVRGFYGTMWFRAVIAAGTLCDPTTNYIQVRTFDTLAVWTNTSPDFDRIVGGTVSAEGGAYLVFSAEAEGFATDPSSPYYNQFEPIPTGEVTYEWQMRCEATDAFGPITGTGISVTSDVPPVLTITSEFYEDPDNANCQFQLVARWTRDGRESELIMGPFTIADDRDDLTIPTIAIQTDTICEGTDFTFTITPTPAPNWSLFDISWAVNGEIVPGEMGQSFTITNAQVETPNPRTVRAVIRVRPEAHADYLVPENDSAVAEGTLFVVAPFTLPVWPADTVVCRDGNLQLVATITNSLEDVPGWARNFRWINVETSDVEVESHVLDLTNVQENGVFRFEAFNDWCDTESSSQIAVNVMGLIEDDTWTRTVSGTPSVPGTDICIPDGTPYLTIVYTAPELGLLNEEHRDRVVFNWFVDGVLQPESGATFTRNVAEDASQPLTDGSEVRLEVMIPGCDMVAFTDNIVLNCPTLQLDSIFALIISERRAGNDTVWGDRDDNFNRDSIFLNDRYNEEFVGGEGQAGNRPMDAEGRLHLCVGHIVYFEPRFSGYGDDIEAMNLTFEWTVYPATTYYVGEFSGSTEGAEPFTDAMIGFRVVESETGEMTFTLIVRSNGQEVARGEIVTHVRSTAHVAMHVAPTMFDRAYFENQVINFMMAPGRFDMYEFWRFIGDRSDILDWDNLSNNTNLMDGSRVGDGRENPHVQSSPLFSTRFPAGSIRELGWDLGRLNVPITVVGVAIDQYGCEAISDITIRLIPVPTVLVTEGHSEANRVLFPNFDVEVFNTWGIRMQRFGEARGWDPRFRSREIHSGTYYYNVRIPTPEGYVTISGAITIIREE